jgi:hypothetical protein
MACAVHIIMFSIIGKYPQLPSCCTFDYFFGAGREIHTAIFSLKLSFENHNPLTATNGTQIGYRFGYGFQDATYPGHNIRAEIGHKAKEFNLMKIATYFPDPSTNLMWTKRTFSVAAVVW